MQLDEGRKIKADSGSVDPVWEGSQRTSKFRDLVEREGQHEMLRFRR